MRSSQEIFLRAEQWIPGEVNSLVRAFNAVGGDYIFFYHGKGAYLWDVVGKPYIDYVGSWGALILGNAPEPILESIRLGGRRSG